jgi:hypothetical protein
MSSTDAIRGRLRAGLQRELRELADDLLTVSESDARGLHGPLRTRNRVTVEDHGQEISARAGLDSGYSGSGARTEEVRRQILQHNLLAIAPRMQGRLAARLRREL